MSTMLTHLRRFRRTDERGQVLVIVGAALVGLVAMVGLVVDGGYAWGQQRVAQNGADSVAKAGNVPILEYLAGDATVTMGDVGCAVETAMQESGVELESAEFTDFQGNTLGVTVPLCGSGGAITDDIQGVKATAVRTFDTFLMSVVGIDQLTARANATAVVGPLTGFSVALPVTFPQTLELCDNSDRVYSVRDWNEENVAGGPAAQPNQWDPYEILPEGETPGPGNLAIIPLCGTEPGSVGWLEYGCGNIQQAISNPCQDLFINIPDWIQTQTGNINCCEGEINSYGGDVEGTFEPDKDQVVALPIHQVTCENDAGTSGTGTSRALNPCTAGPGEGNNLWYGVEFWVGFAVDSSHVQGSDVECRTGVGEPKLVSPTGYVGCLKGWFVERIGHPDQISIGEIDPGFEGQFGITLIN